MFSPLVGQLQVASKSQARPLQVQVYTLGLLAQFTITIAAIAHLFLSQVRPSFITDCVARTERQRAIDTEIGVKVFFPLQHFNQQRSIHM